MFTFPGIFYHLNLPRKPPLQGALDPDHIKPPRLAPVNVTVPGCVSLSLIRGSGPWIMRLLCYSFKKKGQILPKSDDCATLCTLSCWANLVVLSLNDWLPHSVAKPTITQLGQGSSYVLAFLHSIKKNTPFQASPHSVFPDFRVTLNTPPIVADKTWNFVHTEVKHNKSLLHQNYASSKWLQYKDCIVHVYVISSVQTTR